MSFFPGLELRQVLDIHQPTTCVCCSRRASKGKRHWPDMTSNTVIQAGRYHETPPHQTLYLSCHCMWSRRVAGLQCGTPSPRTKDRACCAGYLADSLWQTRSLNAVVFSHTANGQGKVESFAIRRQARVGNRQNPL